MNVSARSLTVTSASRSMGAELVGTVVDYTLLYIIGGNWGLSLFVV